MLDGSFGSLLATQPVIKGTVFFTHGCFEFFHLINKMVLVLKSLVLCVLDETHVNYKTKTGGKVWKANTCYNLVIYPSLINIKCKMHVFEQMV